MRCRRLLGLGVVVLCVFISCAASRKPTTGEEWRETHRRCREGAAQYCDWSGVGMAPSRPVDAVRAFRIACEAGYPDGCAHLAGMLQDGTGVARDYAAALPLLEKACDQGSADACHRLGVSWFRGRGVARTPEKSTPLYERACAGGVAEACRDLAKAISEGRGVPVDVPRVMSLYRKSCPEVDDSCGNLAISLRAQGAQDEALEVALSGCRAGGKSSCTNAALSYRAKSDLVNARRYARVACAWGEELACHNLAAYLEDEPAGDLDEMARVLRLNCRAGYKSSCHSFNVVSERDGGATEATTAEYVRLCGLGELHSCNVVCARRTATLEERQSACAAACPKYKRACERLDGGLLDAADAGEADAGEVTIRR